MEFDELSNWVIGCAIEVHRELGPRLLESPYEQCLVHELKLNGIRFKCTSAIGRVQKRKKIVVSRESK